MFDCLNFQIPSWHTEKMKENHKVCYILYAEGGVKGCLVWPQTTTPWLHQTLHLSISFLLYNTSDCKVRRGLPSRLDNFIVSANTREQHCTMFWVVGEALGPALSPNRKRLLLFFHLDQGEGGVTTALLSRRGAGGGSKGGGGAVPEAPSYPTHLHHNVILHLFQSRNIL